MSRKTTRRVNRTPASTFFRRPVVQIGLVAIAVIVIALIALTGSGQSSSGLPAEISAAQAYELYQQKAVFFVDVREQSEWDTFHIPDTTLIPLGELPNRLNELPKDRQIVVVCRTGHRSASGRDILKQAGFTKVTSMTGGVTEWKAQGYPIQP